MPDGPSDVAWKMHGALMDWTGKVDSKASFSLAVQSATLLAVIGLAGANRRLSGLSGVALYAFWTGISLLTVGVLCSAYTVRPRLRRRRVREEASSNFVYFGHAMYWNPEELQAALTSRDLLPVLTRQIVAMSKIAWMKHRLVQVSISTSTVGTLALGVAAVLARD